MRTILINLVVCVLPLVNAQQPRGKTSAKTPKESEPPNAALCRDFGKRAAGWDRTIIETAQRKAQTEIKLVNCKAKEKDKQTLPRECDQFEDQIKDWTRQLDHAKQEKEKLRSEYQRYCR